MLLTAWGFLTVYCLETERFLFMMNRIVFLQITGIVFNHFNPQSNDHMQEVAS